MTDKRDPRPYVRRAAQRILSMVLELHKLGYQRLRIVPGMSPSGRDWRCDVTHVGNILKKHGAMCKDFQRDTVFYTSSQDNAYFGWQDARQDTARQLAEKFLERFPEIAQKGLGADWLYVGWYVQMLGLAERGIFPIAYAEWHGHAPDPHWLPTTEGVQSGLPMPPGGEASDEDTLIGDGP